MVRGKKKEKELTPEEKLQQALMPVDEQPYKIPESWCWISVSYLSSVISKGTTPKGGKNAYTVEGVNFLRVENINSDGSISHDNIMHISEEMHQGFLKRSILQKGDIIVSIAGTLGKTAIVRSSDLPLNTNQAVSFIRIKNGFANRKYVKYSFDNPVIQDHLLSQTKVTSIPNLTLEIIGKCPIPLPPLPEQQRIVNRIESLFAKLDEAKEKAQAVVDGFEDRKAAILYKAFTGQLTEGWREKKQISKNEWSIIKLSDACKVNPPKMNTKSLPDDLKVSFYPMPALSEKYGIITEPQTRFLGEVRTGYTNFSKGDVVFAKITPCMENGKAAVIEQLENNIGFGTTEFFVLRCGDKLYNRFLWHLVRNRSFRDEAKAVMTGAVGQQRVPKSFLENYTINLPPIVEQFEIVRILDDCFDKEYLVKESAEQVIDQIDSMKKAILARAFRGELGTNDPTDESAEELLKRIL